MIQFFKDGDNMGLLTDVQDPIEFGRQLSDALSHLIDADCYQGDWEFQLGFWLPCAFEIWARLKGYKADVEERRTIYAGSSMVSDREVVATYDRGETIFDRATGLSAALHSIVNNLESASPSEGSSEKKK